MRVLVVAQAFKESLGVDAVATALARGVREAGGEPEVLRASDGGDGLLDALGPLMTRWSTCQAEDPLGRPLTVRAGWLDDATAVMESRLVCGLSLLTVEQRDPLHTSSRGVGTMIAALVRAGASRVIVGLGGSATVDGGLGMARAWGWVPRDAAGAELPEGGGALERLARLAEGWPPGAALVGLCDVRHPLTGPDGAAPVFGPQKGASPVAVEILARGLERLAAATERGDLATRPGAGAAGGLGFGLLCFGQGELHGGAEWVLTRLGFGEALRRAAAVVVGEGRFDRTSLEGKLSGEVIQRAGQAGVPVVLLAPEADGVPPGVVVEAGGGWWSAEVLAARAREGVARLFRLLPR